jgi:hypothetical protein
VAIREQALGLEDLEVATCLHNLAVLHKDAGRFTAAQRPDQGVLDPAPGLRRYWGVSHPTGGIDGFRTTLMWS